MKLGILTSQDEIRAVYLKENDVLFCSLHLQVGQIMSYTIQPGIYSPLKKKKQIVDGHRLELGILTSQDKIIAAYLKGNDVFILFTVSTSWSDHELYNSTRYLFTSKEKKS